VSFAAEKLSPANLVWYPRVFAQFAESLHRFADGFTGLDIHLHPRLALIWRLRDNLVSNISDLFL
jgi:hypothetical protein